MKFKFLMAILMSNVYLFAGPKYIKLIDRCTAKFTKEIYNEKKLYLSGYGGRMMNDVEEVDLYLDIQMHASINEARKLFVEASERYLAIVNEDVKVRPFLRNYPFTIDNLSFSIGFKDPTNHFENDLAYVMYCQRTGCIVYNAYDPDNTESNPLYTIYEEPYEEAVRLVKEGR